jgi:hypothetical protein
MHTSFDEWMIVVTLEIVNSSFVIMHITSNFTLDYYNDATQEFHILKSILTYSLLTLL